MLPYKSTRLALLTALAVACASVSSAQMLINGAGATFPQQIYTKWFDEYQKIDGSVRFNYQGIGSGGGQKQILAETVDFGASDKPGQKVTIDAAYVRAHVSDLAKNADLSKFVL